MALAAEVQSLAQGQFTLTGRFPMFLRRCVSLESGFMECFLFLAQTGVDSDHHSPYQLLLRLKMQHAAEQLQNPVLLVKQVAEAAGFADPFQFSRTFKREFGLSTDAFRRL